MKTLEKFVANTPIIPTATIWLLNDLAEYRGKQALFTKQSPQKLKTLCEHALIESAISSTRIEGVEIDQKRVGTVVFGKGNLQDRNEEEVRGYQLALKWIHEDFRKIRVSPASILQLHKMTRPNIWDSGKFKKDDGKIIEKHADGRITIRFIPTPAAETPNAMNKLCDLSNRLLCDRDIPPLVIWAAHNLDFLCIHPFRDGNGRVSRLLLLLTLYHLGFEAGRYVSLEHLIEKSKERYYETLKISSQSWHEGRHDPWPYVNYLLFTMKELYAEFEQRYENTAIAIGEKTNTVQRAIMDFSHSFHFTELHKQCPEVSPDMIRKVLKDMKRSGQVECIGRGKLATWRVLGNG